MVVLEEQKAWWVHLKVVLKTKQTIKWQKFCLTRTFFNLHVVRIHYSDWHHIINDGASWQSCQLLFMRQWTKHYKNVGLLHLPTELKQIIHNITYDVHCENNKFYFVIKIKTCGSAPMPWYRHCSPQHILRWPQVELLLLHLTWWPGRTLMLVRWCC